jgi:hypothetical protein
MCELVSSSIQYQSGRDPRSRAEPRMNRGFPSTRSASSVTQQLIAMKDKRRLRRREDVEVRTDA